MTKRFTGLEGIEGRCPEPSGYESKRHQARLREFKKGWYLGRDKKTFKDPSTLDTLTWHNLGWRLGWMLGGEKDADDRLDAIFDQLVLQYRDSGRVE